MTTTTRRNLLGLTGAAGLLAVTGSMAPAAAAATATTVRRFEFDTATVGPSSKVASGQTIRTLSERGISALTSAQNNLNPAALILPARSTAVVRSGSASLRTSIASGAGYARSEFVAEAFPVGRTTASSPKAMAFDMYVPSSYLGPRNSYEWTMVSQVWQSATGSPPIAMRLMPTSTAGTLNLYVELRNDTTSDDWRRAAVNAGTVPIRTGRWVRVLQEWDTSRDRNKGFYKLSLDGRVVIHRKATQIGYTVPSGASPTMHAKAGLYHSSAKTNQRIDVYYDRIVTGPVGSVS